MKSTELKTFFIIFGVMGFFYLSLLTTITYTDIDALYKKKIGLTTIILYPLDYWSTSTYSKIGNW
jgi:hypothetical protein